MSTVEADNGGPAFPNPAPLDDRYPGMTLRDYFAGQALAALAPLGATGEVDDYGPRNVASDAYGYADAMLKARKR
jgi:hypothetical protein